MSNAGAKDDHEKLRLSLVPRGIVEAIATIREYGTKKYGNPDNWKIVEPQRFWEAALRHMEAARDDFQAVDPESGHPHIWHVACNLAFIIALARNKKPEPDDLSNRSVNIMPCKKGGSIAVGKIPESNDDFFSSDRGIVTKKELNIE